MKIRKITFIAIILFCFICTGCGFKLRSASSFPTELKHVYFSSDKPYSILSIRLKTLLRSMDVTVVRQKAQAPFSIIISNDYFIYDRPAIVNVALPTSLNFSQTANIAIENNKNNNIIALQNFTTAQSLTLNANQMYTTNANALMQQELTKEMISLIYYWLVSSNTKAALHHANNPKAIKYTS